MIAPSRKIHPAQPIAAQLAVVALVSITPLNALADETVVLNPSLGPKVLLGVTILGSKLFADLSVALSHRIRLEGSIAESNKMQGDSFSSSTQPQPAYDSLWNDSYQSVLGGWRLFENYNIFIRGGLTAWKSEYFRYESKAYTVPQNFGVNASSTTEYHYELTASDKKSGITPALGVRVGLPWSTPARELGWSADLSYLKLDVRIGGKTMSADYGGLGIRYGW